MPSPPTFRRLATVVAVFVLALPIGAAFAATHSVSVVDNEFEPPTITVTAGDTVEWTHDGSNPHTVTASDGSWDSHPDCESFDDDCMMSGDTYSETFDETGEFTYYCKLHGTADGEGMAGTVVVQAAQDDSADDTDETGDETTQAEPTGTISASDQTGDGTTVEVDSLSIDGASGFVVVHRDDDGAPGEVIGHQAIAEGSSSDVTVTLDTALEDSQALWPMLHVDAGEVGTYEFPGSDVPVTADGEIVMVQIDYTVAAEDTDALPETGVSSWWVAAAGLAVLALLLGGRLVRRRPRSVA